MWHETHRCAVDGCPNLAAYEVLLYDFDVTEGATHLDLDETCPFICVEHAIENERRAMGDRRPSGSLEYPFTNLRRLGGRTVYRQPEMHFTAPRD